MTDPKKPTGNEWLTMSRRSVLKALISVPVFGAFFLTFLKKKAGDDVKRRALLAELGVSESGPAVIRNAVSRPPGKRIRLAIIGYGGEGESLVRHAGFAHPDWIDEAKKNHDEDPRDKELETYLGQDDLNVQLTAVCDLFDVRADRAIAASQVTQRPGGGATNAPAKRFRRYTDLLASGEVDAVIIATPDHWHAPITIAAAGHKIPV